MSIEKSSERDSPGLVDCAQTDSSKDWDNNLEFICGASLYWEKTLWQRPHQIMSRLALTNKVLYVRPIDLQIYLKNKNSPISKNRFSSPLPNLSLFSPLILPYSRKCDLIRKINNMYMINRIRKASKNKNKKILWLYSPMSSYIIKKLDESLVIYDCMDDHSAFLNAQKELVSQEEFLLKRADIVFTGGKSLFESQQDKNKATYLFPSAVDFEHFSKARDENIAIPHDLINIPKPIIGYFGAIDERLNYSLIDKLAQKNDNYSFVLIGPRLKVNPEILPKKKNIYYLGEKDYSSLPSYLKGFDVGYMPFALNRSTEKISPTKTLEYMAAGCRVVSTSVRDVVSTYENLISIADDVDGMSHNIENILENNKSDVREAGIAFAKRHSWDDTVCKMKDIILEKLKST